uniref:Uncharacterized protein n=1 Tax=Rhodosorus marinus TaxID=101924 RepID=A0A6T6NJN7_9RHOD
MDLTEEFMSVSQIRLTTLSAPLGRHIASARISVSPSLVVSLTIPTSFRVRMLPSPNVISVATVRLGPRNALSAGHTWSFAPESKMKRSGFLRTSPSARQQP